MTSDSGLNTYTLVNHYIFSSNRLIVDQVRRPTWRRLITLKSRRGTSRLDALLAIGRLITPRRLRALSYRSSKGTRRNGWLAYLLSLSLTLGARALVSFEPFTSHPSASRWVRTGIVKDRRLEYVLWVELMDGAFFIHNQSHVFPWNRNQWVLPVGSTHETVIWRSPLNDTGLSSIVN